MRCSRCQPRATSSPPGTRLGSTSIIPSSSTRATYSVPYELARQVVEVRATANIVELPIPECAKIAPLMAFTTISSISTWTASFSRDR